MNIHEIMKYNVYHNYFICCKEKMIRIMTDALVGLALMIFGSFMHAAISN